MKLATVFSTGDHGAARGALEAAGELGLAIGGHTASTDLPPELEPQLRRTLAPRMAARLNVQDSDGALILSFGPDLRDGSPAAYADKAIEHQRKPSLHIVLPAGGRSTIPEDVRKGVLAWIAEEKIATLHVTGPREADEPGIQQAVHDALVWIFEDEMGPRATFEGVDRTAAPERLAGAVIDKVCRDTGVTLRNEERLLIDTIAHIAADVASRPLRPPMTTEDALRQVAATGDDEARLAAIAELAHRRVDPARVFDPADTQQRAVAIAGVMGGGALLAAAEWEDLDAMPDPVDSAAPAATHLPGAATTPGHDYLSAGDTPYASGDRCYTGCVLCGRPRKEHRG